MQTQIVALVVHADLCVRRVLCDVLFDVLGPVQLICSADGLSLDDPHAVERGRRRVMLVELQWLQQQDQSALLFSQPDVLLALAQAPTHADWCAGRVLGADMVLDTMSSPAELADLIRSVLEGPGNRRTPAPEPAIKVPPGRTNGHPGAAQTGLTSRQQDVLDRIREGHTNQMIAAELGISENTVRLHVSAILKALNVRNRTAAALLPRA